jgi:cytidylate kinase
LPETSLPARSNRILEREIGDPTAAAVIRPDGIALATTRVGIRESCRPSRGRESFASGQGAGRRILGVSGYPRLVTSTPSSRPRPSPGLVVALDGPASSGKSSVGAAAAEALGYRFCDTGLLYRAATWLALKREVSAEGDPAALVALVPEIELIPDAAGRLAHVSVDGDDVTDDVHTPVVDEHVSAISRVSELRAALLERQRALADEPGGIIMAGRDIGTVVLPSADLKIFLDASVEERARRRTMERGIVAGSAEGRQILVQLRQRDELDRNRAVAPLRPADDAVHIVTDGNQFEDTVRAVVAAIRAAEERASVAPGRRT